jgi:LemA protein
VHRLIPYIVTGFAIAGVMIYLVAIYNGLVGLRNDIDKAWANIDVLLKQRHDEVPRLVEVCKGYMQYEAETLRALSEARMKYALATTVTQKAVASGRVSDSVLNLFAVAQHYPDLKANVVFLELQKQITELESQIADRREYFNDAINLFNTRIQEMPDKLLAGPMGLKPRAMFQVTATEKSTVKVVLAPTHV